MLPKKLLEWVVLEDSKYTDSILDNYYIWQNPNGIDFFRENIGYSDKLWKKPRKIDWRCLSTNPNGIDLILKYPKIINNILRKRIY